jgi:serine/threonine-protein kinase
MPLIEAVSLSSNKDKDLFQALDLLNQAVARDPNFLLAYCWLARAHDSVYQEDIDHTPARLAMAKSAIDSAFRLKADSGEAHLALGLHFYWGYFDYDRARAELAIARRTLPNNPQLFEVTGWIDRRQGRWPDAVRNFERASELDPRNFFLARYLAGTYFTVRAYDQTSKALGRAYALNPDDIGNRIDRGGELEMHWRADTRRWHATIEKILADDPASAEDQLMREERFRLALFERDFAAADRATAALPNKNPFGDGFSRSFWVGLAARTKGDMAAAQAAFTTARAEQEAEIRARPNDASLLSGLGVIDAALGRKEEALREGRRAVEVVPVADKSLEVPSRVANLAWICAWIGERDLAIEKLEIAVGEIPAGATYGELRLNPIWDSLRDDPRFEKIVASLAPK